MWWNEYKYSERMCAMFGYVRGLLEHDTEKAHDMDAAWKFLPPMYKSYKFVDPEWDFYYWAD
jgi:hypothetical protein